MGLVGGGGLFLGLLGLRGGLGLLVGLSAVLGLLPLLLEGSEDGGVDLLFLRGRTILELVSNLIRVNILIIVVET